jgi:hypothetical protein
MIHSSGEANFSKYFLFSQNAGKVDLLIQDGSSFNQTHAAAVVA